MTHARASVVVPAHDEAAGIQTTLTSLLASAAAGEFEVVVVCNGCTDDTADRAAQVPGVRVEQIGAASKVAALGRGDEIATVFPRVYLDADVELTTAGLRALVRALEAPDVRVAGLRGKVRTGASTRAVRWYFDFRQRLPVFHQGIIGAGVYALDEDARARFEAWPAVLGDDQYVLRLFGRHERVLVDDHHTVVHAPPDLRTLLRRQLRVRRGNRELTVGAPQVVPMAAPRAGVGVAVRSVAASPRAWPGLLVWVSVNTLVRVLERFPSAHDWSAGGAAR